MLFVTIYGQLFGIFHFEDGGLGTFVDLFLEVFHIVIAGQEIKEDMFKYNPIGVFFVYMVTNIFTFLILSQALLPSQSAHHFHYLLMVSSICPQSRRSPRGRSSSPS